MCLGDKCFVDIGARSTDLQAMSKAPDDVTDVTPVTFDQPRQAEHIIVVVEQLAHYTRCRRLLKRVAVDGVELAHEAK